MGVAARSRGLLAAALALGMAGSIAFLAQALAARGRVDPSLRPAMDRQVDGGLMEQYLKSAEEKKSILRWVRARAPSSGWREIGQVFEERCVSCHFSGAERLVPLDQYETAAAVSRARPVLKEKLEWGSMARYLEDPEQKETVLRWMDRGAPEADWSAIGKILARNCLSCHNPQGVRGLVPLDRYARVARIAVLPAVERSPLAVALPAATLLGAGFLLHRIWRGR